MVDKSQIASRPYSRWPHRLALTLCFATFPLIWLGGLVTSYDAGMAVPDWPTTYGYNLFLYPWKTWLFGPFDLFIEHGHRLLAASVGMLSIVFLIVVWLRDDRRWMKYAAASMLAIVCLQGGLGGVRVLLDERVVALIHACMGLATFAYAAALAVVTSRYWREGISDSEIPTATLSKVLRLAILTSAITYIQVILGALLRHVPVNAPPSFFRVAVLFHLLLGGAVLVHALLLALRITRDCKTVSRLTRPVGALGLLVLVQIALGGATWVVKYGWPSWISELPFSVGYTVQANSLPQTMIATAHVAVGALILATSVVLSVRVWRFFRVEPREILNSIGMNATEYQRGLEGFGRIPSRFKLQARNN